MFKTPGMVWRAHGSKIRCDQVARIADAPIKSYFNGTVAVVNQESAVTWQL
jgi:hypothetical protein